MQQIKNPNILLHQIRAKKRPSLVSNTLATERIKMPDHLKTLINKIEILDRSEPPAPWCKRVVYPVGGLRSVGFQDDADILLVVSEQGRGIIDCIADQKLARDHEEYYEDEIRLEADGIGPLAGKKIRISGLYGGGLPNSTSDGWSIETVTLSWPEEILFLVEPASWFYGSLYGQPDNFRKVFSGSEIRAKGFSPTGRTFVIATSSDLTIYTRNAAG
jgi:hypothetical protein